MAWLREVNGPGGFCPGARGVIGRAETCALVLGDRSVSGEHASLVHRDGGWWLRDLGSRNGTRVDGETLEPGAPRPVRAGATVHFGAVAWRVVADSPPGPIGLCGDVHRATSGAMLALPSDADPQVVVFDDGDGGWLAEVDGEPVLVDGARDVTIDGATWQIRVPAGRLEGLATTWELAGAAQIERVGLRFKVSLDEEHIEVTAALPTHEVDLGTRAHHQLLLTLARARLEDRGADVPPAEEGWRYADDVRRMLRLDRPQLNQFVFRARHELDDAGVEGAPRVIERRAGSGQVRLGVREVVVASF